MAEEKFLNHLAGETSPYLLQHAHNPVEWFPWNEEALQKAKREDKPVLISIGYSACHWCHVMAHESFEDAETAHFMNEHFVNIKIDREERPDIDHIYMDAVQAMTGSGGWPLNVFLTPDLKPFYGGTYFPPRKAYNRPSWKETLGSVLNAFQKRRQEVESQADQLVAYLQNSSGAFLKTEEIVKPDNEEQHIQEAFKTLSGQFDSVHGGFGGAPKFPSTFCIRFLFLYNRYYPSREALHQALLSIDQMMEGGIYDHLGGGFARYSTDAKWLVPHFEKMLYDNALLLETLAEAFQITQEKKYKDKIRQTIDFVFRELSDQGKDFYAALDADSEGIEGKFYVWTKTEVEKILGEDAEIFCAFYDVTEEGNWEGKNILHEVKDMDTLLKRFQISESILKQNLEDSRQKLFGVRDQRIHPGLDDKKILSWNALMVSALAKCAQALNDEEFRRKTIELLHNLLSSFRINETGEMVHHITKGKPSGKAMLDDYAYLIRACLLAYEISFDETLILTAGKLAGLVIADFYDEAENFFFMTAKDEKNLIVRSKDFYDGAVPSGNAVMAENLLRVSVLLDEKDFAKKSEAMLQAILQSAVKFPSSFSWWLMNLLVQWKGSEELVVIGNDFISAVNEINRHYIPAKILMASENAADNFPLLKDKMPVEGKVTFYRCRNYSCQLPTNSLTEFLKPFTAK